MFLSTQGLEAAAADHRIDTGLLRASAVYRHSGLTWAHRLLSTSFLGSYLKGTTKEPMGGSRNLPFSGFYLAIGFRVTGTWGLIKDRNLLFGGVWGYR